MAPGTPGTTSRPATLSKRQKRKQSRGLRPDSSLAEPNAGLPVPGVVGGACEVAPSMLATTSYGAGAESMASVAKLAGDPASVNGLAGLDLSGGCGSRGGMAVAGSLPPPAVSAAGVYAFGALAGLPAAGGLSLPPAATSLAAPAALGAALPMGTGWEDGRASVVGSAAALPTPAAFSHAFSLLADPARLADKVSCILDKCGGRSVVDQLTRLGYAELLATRACLEVYASDKTVDVESAVKWIREQPGDPNVTLNRALNPLELIKYQDLSAAVAKVMERVPGITQQSAQIAIQQTFGDIDAAATFLAMTLKSPLPPASGVPAVPMPSLQPSAQVLAEAAASGWDAVGGPSSTGQPGCPSTAVTLDFAAAAAVVAPGLQGLAADAAAASCLWQQLAPGLQGLVAAPPNGGGGGGGPPTSAGDVVQWMTSAMAKATELQLATDKLAALALHQQQQLQAALTASASASATSSAGTLPAALPPNGGAMASVAPFVLSTALPPPPVAGDAAGSASGQQLSVPHAVGGGSAGGASSSSQDMLAPLVMSQHLAMEWQREKAALASELEALQGHKEWADKKIAQLIKRVSEAERPARDETARLKEEVGRLRCEKEVMEAKLREFESSLCKLKDCTYQEAAAKREYERKVAAAQAELRGAALREQELHAQLREAQSGLKTEKKRREAAERQAKKVGDERHEALATAAEARAELAALQASTAAAKKSAEERIALLEQQQALAQQAQRSAQLEAEQLGSEKSSLATLLEARNSTVAAQKQALAEMQAALEARAAEVAALQASLAQVRAQAQAVASAAPATGAGGGGDGGSNGSLLYSHWGGSSLFSSGGPLADVRGNGGQAAGRSFATGVLPGSGLFK